MLLDDVFLKKLAWLIDYEVGWNVDNSFYNIFEDFDGLFFSDWQMTNFKEFIIVVIVSMGHIGMVGFIKNLVHFLLNSSKHDSSSIKK